MRYSFLSLLVGLSFLGTAMAQDVDYQVVGGIWDSSFEASIDGQTVVLTDLPECLQLEAVEDFDGNGYRDALVADVIACGGNGVGNEYFFVYYDGETFQATETFGYSWDIPLVELWQDELSVYTVSNNAGFHTEDEQIIRERHVLREGQAVQVWFEESEELEALLELRSSAFDVRDTSATTASNPPTSLSITFDLDKDGNAEIIRCGFFERWGALDCSTTLQGYDTYIPANCRRLGVLASKHNGVHDLVCGDETIYSWTGEAYEAVTD